MKNHIQHLKLTAITLVSMFLISCASTPDIDPRVVALEQRFNDLISQPELATRGGEELERAQKALNQVKNQFEDMEDEEQDYALYATDRLIDLAQFKAQTRWYEDQRDMLVDEQSKLVLESRTLEADLAQQRAANANASAEAARMQRQIALEEAEKARMMRDEALSTAALAEQQKQLALEARAEAERLKLQAEEAANSAMSEAEKAKIRAEAEAARAEAARAEAEAAKAAMNQLKEELTELKTRQTDRGLVITLGDVLFEFNKSELIPGAARNLEPLVVALKDNPEQTIEIEGHTDSIGSEQYNIDLSKKRADAVKSFLVRYEIDANRISTKGLGYEFPVASNKTEAGRQQNRRVEIILPK